MRSVSHVLLFCLLFFLLQDFYKPHLHSPYPVVDGKFSNSCYLRSLDICYQRFAQKYAQAHAGKPFSVIEDAQHVLFHAPYNKLVQKSFARLLFNEFLSVPSAASNPSFAALKPFAATVREQSYEDVPLEKAAVAVSKNWYADKVSPGILIPQHLGNMYTASLYAGLMSLVSTQSDKLAGKRLLMFSYGSGLAASMFSLKVASGDAAAKALVSMAARADIPARLEDRTAIAPAQFNEWMETREKLHAKQEGAFELQGSTDPKEFFQGAFVLTERDANGRRKYQQIQ
jgi:hydroxymethylglutaryl-CoA synthase